MISNQDYSDLQQLLKKIEKLLPEQAPLQFFVHHNTLHAFENLPFKDALKSASLKFFAEPFLSEENFQKALDSDRITAQDLAEIIRDECKNSAEEIFSGAPTHFEFRNWRLQNLFFIPDFESLDWWMRKNKLLAEEESQLLWQALEVKNYSTDSNPKKIRSRDKILALHNVDSDELTHPILINLAGSFLDQGIAFHTLPERSKGFLFAFKKLYLDENFPCEAWMRNLKKLHLKNLSAAEITVKILNNFGVEKANWEEFIFQTLLSLKGWAGMFAHFAHHPDHIPVQVLPACLEDFLAVQLILDFAAAQFILKKIGSDLEEINRSECKFFDPEKQAKLLQFESFVTARAFNLDAENFDAESVKKWHTANADFNDFERRYHLHLAYEKKHRQDVIDGIIAHKKLAEKKSDHVSFQAVLCFDEREESFRRQLEEICPTVETYGFAGFFGVAIQYLGLDDIKPRALCPIVITPEVLVEEVTIGAEIHSYNKAKKRIGKIHNFIKNSRKSLLRGSFWSFLAGIFKVIPLMGHSLFPLHTERAWNRLRKLGIYRPQTRLSVKCNDEKVRRYGFRVGFTLKEMSDILFNGLTTMDLKNNFCDVVMLIGHHSSSLNNPHESAYNCGATGGGNGGINARALAVIANDLAVRQELKLRGIEIPDSTWFIAAAHDTCNDFIEYYDLDLLPENLQKDFRFIRATLTKACNHNAHERCRRFESVPKKISPLAAQKYVESRAMDLAQPRPEYGHGTNAVCIVGQREKTRGLFLDRRAFLISYNPQKDLDGKILANLLQAVMPVGSGINLEYYFSTVDSFSYGCGTKLPHNITGLIGVMDGYSSDLRSGLPWQTVEIHEPVRMLTIIEATTETLLEIAKEKPAIEKLIKNDWIQLIAWNPHDGSFYRFHRGKFIKHVVETVEIPSVKNSQEFYKGRIEHLNCAHVLTTEGD